MAVLLFVLALNGCVSPAGKLDDSLIAQIKEGISTEQDVERLLGPPVAKVTGSNGKSVVGYRAIKTDSRADPNANDSARPGADGQDYDRHLHVRTLSVLYGRDGRVEAHHFYVSDSGFSVGPTRARLGMAVQPGQLKLIVRGVTPRASLIENFGNPIGEYLNISGELILAWMYLEGGGASREGQLLEVMVDRAGLALDFRVVENSLDGQGR